MWILLFSEVTPFEYSVSTILSPIVADESRSLTSKVQILFHKIKLFHPFSHPINLETLVFLLV